MSDHSVHFTSARTSNGRDDWGTPRELFDALDAEFCFGLDCAANAQNALCGGWLGTGSEFAENALAASWHTIASGWGCWLNPPYSMLRDFMAKAHIESRLGATVVCLIPARTDTRAWHDHVMRAAEIRLVRGRLKFVGGKACAPFPSAIVIFKPGHVGGPALSACGRDGVVAPMAQEAAR